jgi:hypothetical protein
MATRRIRRLCNHHSTPTEILHQGWIASTRARKNPLKLTRFGGSCSLLMKHGDVAAGTACQHAVGGLCGGWRVEHPLLEQSEAGAAVHAAPSPSAGGTKAITATPPRAALLPVLLPSRLHRSREWGKNGAQSATSPVAPASSFPPPSWPRALRHVQSWLDPGLIPGVSCAAAGGRGRSLRHQPRCRPCSTPWPADGPCISTSAFNKVPIIGSSGKTASKATHSLVKLILDSSRLCHAAADRAHSPFTGETHSWRRSVACPIHDYDLVSAARQAT